MCPRLRWVDLLSFRWLTRLEASWKLEELQLRCRNCRKKNSYTLPSVRSSMIRSFLNWTPSKSSQKFWSIEKRISTFPTLSPIYPLRLSKTLVFIRSSLFFHEYLCKFLFSWTIHLLNRSQLSGERSKSDNAEMRIAANFGAVLWDLKCSLSILSDVQLFHDRPKCSGFAMPYKI